MSASCRFGAQNRRSFVSPLKRSGPSPQQINSLRFGHTPAIQPGVTGIAIATGSPAGLEGILAGAPAPQPEATVILPDAFASLLALLGVTPLSASDESLAPEASPQREEISESPETTHRPPATVSAAPEQIASAIIRAMLARAEAGPVAPELPTAGLALPPLPTIFESEDPAPVGPACVSPTDDLNLLEPVTPNHRPPRLVIKDEADQNDPAPLTAAQVSAPPVELAPQVVTAIPMAPVPVLPAALPVPSSNAPDAPPRSEAQGMAAPESPVLIASDAAPSRPRTVAETSPSTAPSAFALRLTPKQDQPVPQPVKSTSSPDTAPLAPPAQAGDSRQQPSEEEPPAPKIAPKSPPPQTPLREPESEPRRTPIFEAHPQPEAAPLLAPKPVAELAPITVAAPTLAFAAEPLAPPPPQAPPAAPAPIQEHPQPTATPHQFAIRVSEPSAAPVDLHLAQRGNEIRVAVRTPDEQLQSSLRQDLNQLVNNLDRAGFHTESLAHATVGSLLSVNRSPDTGTFDSQTDSRQPDSRQQSFDNASGDSRSGARQQQQQRRNQHPEPEWIWLEQKKEDLQ